MVDPKVIHELNARQGTYKKLRELLWHRQLMVEGTDEPDEHVITQNGKEVGGLHGTSGNSIIFFHC